MVTVGARPSYLQNGVHASATSQYTAMQGQAYNAGAGPPSVLGPGGVRYALSARVPQANQGNTSSLTTQPHVGTSMPTLTRGAVFTPSTPVLSQSRAHGQILNVIRTGPSIEAKENPNPQWPSMQGKPVFRPGGGVHINGHNSVSAPSASSPRVPTLKKDAPLTWAAFLEKNPAIAANIGEAAIPGTEAYETASRRVEESANPLLTESKTIDEMVEEETEAAQFLLEEKMENFASPKTETPLRKGMSALRASRDRQRAEAAEHKAELKKNSEAETQRQRAETERLRVEAENRRTEAKRKRLEAERVRNEEKQLKAREIREQYEESKRQEKENKRLDAERRANEKARRDSATFDKDGAAQKTSPSRRQSSPGRTSIDASVRRRESTKFSTNPVPKAARAVRRSASARATVNDESSRVDAEEAVRQAEAQRMLEEEERQQKEMQERQSKAQSSRARITEAGFAWHCILGISPNAVVDEIKKAFRELALLHHPDKCLDGDENAVTFKHVLDAFRKGLRVAGDPNRVTVPEPPPQQFKPPDRTPPAAEKDLPGVARRSAEGSSRSAEAPPRASATPGSPRANATPRGRCPTDTPRAPDGPPPQVSESLILVSVSADRSARIWNCHKGECDRVARGHTKEISSASCTSDGKFFVTGSFDRTMRIWDVETGACRKTIQDPAGHKASGMMLKAAFSPDGNRIVTVGHGNNLKVWNARAGTCEQVLRGHICDVLCASFAPDGKSIISGSTDRTVRIWNVATGKCHKVLRGHEGQVTGVSLGPLGEAAASVSEDTLAIIWNVTAGNRVLKLEGHTNALNDVCFSRSGDLLATCSEDGYARVWNASSGECMQAIHVSLGSVKCVAFSPDGYYVATGSSDNNVRLWCRTTGKRVQKMIGHEDVVRSVFFASDAN